MLSRVVFDTSKVTRIEVIDHRTNDGAGRVYAVSNCTVAFSLQDDGRTLKVFVDDSFREVTHD